MHGDWKNPVKQGRLGQILISENFRNIIEKFSIKFVTGQTTDLRFNSFERVCGLQKFKSQSYGIIVNDKEHQISQYADDSSLTLDGYAKSLHAALDTLDFFAKLSCL